MNGNLTAFLINESYTYTAKNATVWVARGHLHYARHSQGDMSLWRIFIFLDVEIPTCVIDALSPSLALHCISAKENAHLFGLQSQDVGNPRVNINRHTRSDAVHMRPGGKECL